MGVVYQRLTLATPQDLARIRSIYEASFPPAERKPFDAIAPLIADGPYICMVCQSAHGTIAAFALLLLLPLAHGAFLEYLAVDSSARGQGIGSSLLRETGTYLQAHGIASHMVWEVEPPSVGAQDTPHNRRIRFYENLGAALIVNSAAYRMPNYEGSSPAGVPLRLMELPAQPQPDLPALRQTIAEIYQVAYPQHGELLNAIIQELEAV